MPEPFLLSKLPKDFRTFDGRTPSISPATAAAIKEARRLQDDMQELLEEETDLRIRYTIPDVPRGTPIPAFAAQERVRLGISVDTQLGWRSPSFAFRTWRDKVESLGIFVYVLDMPANDCRGFSLRETSNPTIVISKDEWLDAARTFTLIHEYCHIRINRPGLSDQGRNSTESYCNEFAAQVLMPETALRQVLNLPTHRTAVEWSMTTLRAVSSKLHVSQQALALRLENAGYAKKGFFETVKAEQQQLRKPVKPKTKGQKVIVPPYVTKLSELGARYSGTVLTAHERGSVNDVEAFRLLDLSPKHFEKLRDRIAGRVAPHGPATSLY
jgi:Zn-dependent peptidase ImmA (M78 family)